jgi:hypothetical protein
MPENNLYEYAVIRFVPRVEREEFFNIGVILFSKKAHYIRLEYHLCPDKFNLWCPETDYDDVVSNLFSMKEVANGNKEFGPIAKLDIPERFRWLTAVRSSVVQTSRPHPGKTNNLNDTFERLFRELVL